MAVLDSARFELLTKLGQGGMGVVYGAYDRQRDMRVALKKLRSLEPSRLYRFKREFRALSELSHPNIVELYELIAERSEWLLSMEWVEGHSFLYHVTHGRSESAAARPGKRALDGPPERDKLALGTNESMVESVAESMVESNVESGAEFAAAGVSESNVSGTLTEDGRRAATTPRGQQRRASSRAPRRSAYRHVKDFVDLDRLRTALAQLTDALSALHEARIVHRDLKPSNVMVTDEHRVVLMDFGVVAELGQQWGASGRGMVGTLAYMAPEQGSGRPPSPAVDWYALGVMMYQALTGMLPFGDNGLETLQAKLRSDPTPPAAVIAGVPHELNRLCMRLLARAPDERPAADEIRESLGRVGGERAPVLSMPGDDDLFVGRMSELRALSSALEQVRASQTRCVVVRGLAGMGKTSLVRQFLTRCAAAKGSDAEYSGPQIPDHSREAHRDEAEARRVERSGSTGPMSNVGIGVKGPRDGQVFVGRCTQPAPLFLSARCHERESLQYKALDGAIDALAVHLDSAFASMDDDTREHFLPDEFALAVRLFPVLGRFIAPENRPRRDQFGPAEQRRRAARALRSVLASLSTIRPVVLHIEDLQWVDGDSVTLLALLLADPAPPGLLVVATIRDENYDDPGLEDLRQVLDEWNGRGLFQSIALGPLPSADQRQLLDAVGPAGNDGNDDDDDDDDGSDDRWRHIARQAMGHPLLLLELARHARSQGALSTDGAMSAQHYGLEQIIWHRIERLPSTQRSLIELVALSAEPLPLPVLAGAGGVTRAECERAARALCIERVARVAHIGTRRRLDCYHDKIREAITGHLQPAHSIRRHTRLAQSLEQWGQASPALVARIWHGAGEDERAAAYYVDAGRAAAGRLAFNQAMAHFSRALELVSGARGITRTRLECQAYCGLAEIVRNIGGADIVLRDLERVERAAEELGLHEELAQLHYWHGNLVFPRGDIDGCLEHHTLAGQFARRAGSFELEAKSLGGMGDAYFLRGRMLSAERYFLRGIEVCRSHQLDHVETTHLAILSKIRFFDGDIAGALERGRETIELSETTGDRRSEVLARNMGIWCHLQTGQLDRAEAWSRRYRQLLDEMAIRHFQPLADANDAEIALCRGDRERAAELARRGLEMARSQSFKFACELLLGVLAWATSDHNERRQSLADGVAGLDAGSLGPNYFFFYRTAIEAALEMRDYSAVREFADRLEAYTRLEPLGWCRFVIERARALADYYTRGPDDAAAREHVQALHERALAGQYVMAAVALDVP